MFSFFCVPNVVLVPIEIQLSNLQTRNFEWLLSTNSQALRISSAFMETLSLSVQTCIKPRAYELQALMTLMSYRFSSLQLDSGLSSQKTSKIIWSSYILEKFKDWRPHIDTMSGPNGISNSFSCNEFYWRVAWAHEVSRNTDAAAQTYIAQILRNSITASSLLATACSLIAVQGVGNIVLDNSKLQTLDNIVVLPPWFSPFSQHHGK